MPILPTPTIRARKLGDLSDVGDKVGGGLQTVASGAGGAAKTVAQAPTAAIGAASDKAVKAATDHVKDKAANEVKKYIPYILCGVAVLLIIGIATYFVLRRRNRIRSAAISQSNDENNGRKSDSV